MNATDLELLQRYAREKSEEAFADLVHCHLDLIYSAALRQRHWKTIERNFFISGS